MDEDQLADDPLVQLQSWLEEAGRSPDDSLPMTVATADSAGNPSARIVLLRGLDERGLTFFTNRESRKGVELGANPRAALVLHWSELGRQARVEGRVEETPLEDSAAYWRTRPRKSQIAAWASPQSRVLSSRAELDALVADLTQRFAADDDVPLPPFWGGYRVVPDVVELWERRENRLHDRIRYTRTPDGWRRERLAP